MIREKQQSFASVFFLRREGDVVVDAKTGRFRLADIAQREKTSLIYEYDFGDGWEHEVVVEKVLAADSEKKCAVCLDGKNASVDSRS